MCNIGGIVDSFQQEEKTLNTENQGSWGIFFKNLFLWPFSILHVFYELEQRTVLFIPANGAVHDKNACKLCM